MLWRAIPATTYYPLTAILLAVISSSSSASSGEAVFCRSISRRLCRLGTTEPKTSHRGGVVVSQLFGGA